MLPLSTTPLSAENRRRWYVYVAVRLSCVLVFTIGLLLYQKGGTQRTVGLFCMGVAVLVLLTFAVIGRSFLGIRVRQLGSLKQQKQQNDQELAEFLAQQKKGHQ